MDTQERKALRNMVRVLQTVREEHGDIQIQMLETLLVAALNPDISQSEVMRQTNQSKAAVSRNVRHWTNWTRHHEPGPAYLEQLVDPFETRRRMLRVTPQGQKFLSGLAKVVNSK